jgi:hypothetical protein
VVGDKLILAYFPILTYTISTFKKNISKVMVRNVFSKRQVGTRRHSAAMRDIMKNDKIAKVLNERREQREFYDVLKKHASGGVTRDEFRQTLGELYKKDKTLSHKEVREIGSAMKDVLGKKRMLEPKEEKKSIAPVVPMLTKKKELESNPKSISPAAQPRISLKDNRNFPSQEDTRKESDAVSPSRFKKPTEEAKGLLDDILDKKAA